MSVGAVISEEPVGLRRPSVTLDGPLPVAPFTDRATLDFCVATGGHRESSSRWSFEFRPKLRRESTVVEKVVAMNSPFQDMSELPQRSGPSLRYFSRRPMKLHED